MVKLVGVYAAWSIPSTNLMTKSTANESNMPDATVDKDHRMQHTPSITFRFVLSANYPANNEAIEWDRVNAAPLRSP